jgi:proline iminopeptidase
MKPYLELFPEIEPYQSDFLQVSDLHTLYYEQVGNAQGQPAVYLHGGPGGGVSGLSRRFLDPAFYRTVLFDQRGAGKSTPNAELRENTTWDLVADIERLREHLGIERWLVFGGSWGSSLALAYAITHPERVSGLILRGIFLCRQSEYDWLYQNGASQVYPDGWDEFNALIDPAERGDLLHAYYKLLTSPDESLRLQAARAWCKWETQVSRLIPDQEALAKEEEAHSALALARIEAHYFVNHSYLEWDSYLLDKAPIIQTIPTRVIQGRYDMVCPIRSAWDLKKAVPSIDLRIVPDGGHSIKDPGITSELIQATEDFKALFA